MNNLTIIEGIKHWGILTDNGIDVKKINLREDDLIEQYYKN